jgi:dTDP-4-dehydrorhamnose 3,5-epimerase
LSVLSIEPCEIPEVLVVAPKRFGDARGFFSETWNRRAFEEATGVTEEFVQDNHSLSAEAGVIRGLHFQSPPHAQGKLVRVSRGAVLDVVVDIRKGSPTYGRHVAVELSAENWRQLWVPRGFAHGFCTLRPDTEFLYKVTGYYAPDHDAGLAFDDPALGIAWPVAPEAAVLSDKDRRHPRLADLPDHFSY